VRRTLDDYREFVDQSVLDEIDRLAGRLAGVRCLHVDSTALGGGVAELLASLVPLLENAGITSEWAVFQGSEEFFRATKLVHNALHGLSSKLPDNLDELYRAQAFANLPLVAPEQDFVILHDQQPLGLAAHRGGGGRWIWYCHVDPTSAQTNVWDLLVPFIAACDLAVFHLSDYARELPCLEYFMPPGIDPLSDKNRPVSQEENRKALEQTGLIDVDCPLILQVSRFDRLKDHAGVVDAFRLIRRERHCRLILAGAADDPEGGDVVDELRNVTKKDTDISVLLVDPDSHLTINSLQRRADVIVQYSRREGFGLTITEAMWKGKAVVVRPTGGLATQVSPEDTGLHAWTPEGLARQVLYLLANPADAARLGRNGRETVRRRYLLPVYLRNWLRLLLLLGKKW
jgi:trehalose synthase